MYQIVIIASANFLFYDLKYFAMFYARNAIVKRVYNIVVVAVPVVKKSITRYEHGVQKYSFFFFKRNEICQDRLQKPMRFFVFSFWLTRRNRNTAFFCWWHWWFEKSITLRSVAYRKLCTSIGISGRPGPATSQQEETKTGFHSVDLPKNNWKTIVLFCFFPPSSLSNTSFPFFKHKRQYNETHFWTKTTDGCYVEESAAVLVIQLKNCFCVDIV